MQYLYFQFLFHNLSGGIKGDSCDLLEETGFVLCVWFL